MYETTWEKNIFKMRTSSLFYFIFLLNVMLVMYPQIISQQGDSDDVILSQFMNSWQLYASRGQIKLMSENEGNNWCGTKRKSRVVCVYFSTGQCLLTSAKPFHSWDSLSKVKEEKKLCCGKLQPLNDTYNNLLKKSLPNDTPLGRIALELAAAPLFDLGWAGYRTCGSEGSSVALGFQFGHIQIHFVV